MAINSVLPSLGIALPEAVLALPDPFLSIAVLSVGLLILYFLFQLLSTLRGAIGLKGSSIVLVGPMNSGKTALFYRLKLGEFRETLPSLMENVSVFAPDSVHGAKAMRFVDFPGHGSKRLGIANYLSDAKQVVFCVDGSASNIGVAAQILFEVLTNATVFSMRVPVFIALCKSDLPNFGPVETIISALEKEIGAIRDSREGMIQDFDASSSQQVSLGTVGENFKFDQCPSIVTFGAISSRKPDLKALLENLS